MASATANVFSGLSISGGKRNSFNNLCFSSTLAKPFSFAPRVDMFCRPPRAPVVCVAQTQRKASRSSSKKKTKIIRLVSTAGTGFFYAKKKSKKMDKLELKKYDPKVKRHVLFRESK
ncbi:hypothetical protein VNO78_13580 [Psophocarpus tetragonolobus]|uniref:50S ribosomal protein L33, chloroplastic n=1 Tax=Psophocarpus tetragonolobus TaxID=3891 RepID=A0AAN9XPL5_PSOTE